VTLTPGTRIGSYEVAEQIGVGGMGEVYRATDTNLKRQVAIKVLPEALADDPERLARFQREAEVLASLNHPNIAQIHGLERGESAIALVMELVDGPTLADRIAAGPVPVDEALAIARQIAEALEAAHEQRIIHRDLKPANIKLRPDGMVKVLDFGLAKAMSPAASISPAGTMSPTITTPAMTQAGLILGTAAYMSPEQAKGREADRRSDVWAFGCVLFEMLTGQRAFGGDEMSEVFASVLAREPALAAVPEDVPERIRKVVAACLRKDPRQRIHDIGDARLALEGVFETTVRDESVPVAVRPPLWLRAAPYVAIAALAVALAVVVWRPASVPEVVRFQVHAPPGETLPFGVPAVSPDGRTLAYSVVGADGLRRLHVRDLDTVETRALPGSEGALYSFWAPDGRSLGFISLPDRVLRRVDIRAGSPRDLVADILFNYDLGSIELAAVGTETRTTVLENGESAPVLAPTPGGTTYLLYMLAPDLMAQEYDEASGTVRGEPSVLVSEIAQVALPAVRPAVGVSAAGVLAYQAGRETSEGRLRWVDVQGNPLDLLPEESPLEDPRLSPDESSVVGTRFDADGNQDVWQTDLARLSTSRVTFSEDRDTAPVWSPDGQRLGDVLELKPLADGIRGEAAHDHPVRHVDETEACVLLNVGRECRNHRV
jgi:hypothetical protein